MSIEDPNYFSKFFKNIPRKRRPSTRNDVRKPCRLPFFFEETKNVLLCIIYKSPDKNLCNMAP